MLSELHELFNKLPRHSHPIPPKSSLPRNGIFVFFEVGESYSDHDRIVYVGTHKSSDNLQARIEQHFTQDKNRSILRKHLGRALLREEEPDHKYLPLWDLDITSREDREKNAPLITPEYEEALERRISAYMRESFTFAAVAIESPEERKKWVTKIASTLAQGDDNNPSEDWLGQHSPTERIRTSGLWQVNKLEYEPLTRAELERFAELAAAGK